MRAARLYGPGDVRVEETPVPRPEPGESLVRVTCVGLCGSDLHWYGEGRVGSTALDGPVVPGHELAGVVEEGPLGGRAVAIDPAIPCERCAECRRGYRNLCPNVLFAGQAPYDGGMREYLAWPDAQLFPLPAGLSAEEGVLLEPLGVAVHAVDLGHVRLGASVAVVGCGPIGLMLVALARLAGATHVAAVEPLPHRRDAARRAGADTVLAPEEVEGDTGVGDVAFEVAGTDEAVGLAVRMARPGGRVVLVGIPAEDWTRFPASPARRKGLTLVMSRRMNEVYPQAIGLVERGLVDVSALVSHRFPLTDAAAAFATAAERRGLKVVVEAS